MEKNERNDPILSGENRMDIRPKNRKHPQTLSKLEGISNLNLEIINKSIIRTTKFNAAPNPMPPILVRSNKGSKEALKNNRKNRVGENRYKEFFI